MHFLNNGKKSYHATPETGLGVPCDPERRGEEGVGDGSRKWPCSRSQASKPAYPVMCHRDRHIMTSLWADENPFPVWERLSLEPVVENGTRSQYRETAYLVKRWGHCVPVHTSRRVAVGSTVVGSLLLAVMFDAFASWELATEIISLIIPLSPHFSFTHPTPHPPTTPGRPLPPPRSPFRKPNPTLFFFPKRRKRTIWIGWSIIPF